MFAIDVGQSSNELWTLRKRCEHKKNCSAHNFSFRVCMVVINVQFDLLQLTKVVTHLSRIASIKNTEKMVNNAKVIFISKCTCRKRWFSVHFIVTIFNWNLSYSISDYYVCKNTRSFEEGVFKTYLLLYTQNKEIIRK